MTAMFQDDLHDWDLDRFTLSPSEITLDVHFSDARKRISLRGVRRCLVNNLLISNIIFEAKVVTVDNEPELYNEQIGRLDETYPINPPALPNLFCISASLGAAMTIEFTDIQVSDLP
jgi:hypothetical protein